jgi:carboxypeptidase C (cathepsin A)
MIKTPWNRIGNVALLTGTLTSLICWQSSYLFAQQKTEEETSDKPVELRAPSVTEQSITVDGKSINYKATVGYMIQTDGDGKPIGYFFYTAYTKQGEDSVSRPLTFCFNGGPGSSSIYLHMLTIGPQKAVLLEDGNTQAPPPRLVDNVDTWLGFTDLVFIDPIGTGFSFPHPGADTKQFFGTAADAESVGDFIRMYITENTRWLSPIFVAGESYGGIRGVLLAEELQNSPRIKLNVNGLIFIAPAYDFQSLGTSRHNPMYLSQHVSTYATTAWYHKKLDDDLQADFDQLVKEVTTWASEDYLVALVKGDKLEASKKKEVAGQMARYTGLSEDYILQKNLRITSPEFREELLRDKGMSLHRTDARFELGTYDLTRTLSPVWNHYVRAVLGYDTIKPYLVRGNVQPWAWGGKPYPFSVVPNLSEAMKNNRDMKVFVAAGYYDHACPFATIDYALDQLLLTPELQRNLSRRYYQAGHMVYTPQFELTRFTEDVREFIVDAATPGAHAAPTAASVVRDRD